MLTRNLNPGEEITTNYRMQPELEQPEVFYDVKEVLVLKMTLNKKNSKGYSRSLSATNKLFTLKFLFAKPKSRKIKYLILTQSIMQKVENLVLVENKYILSIKRLVVFLCHNIII